MDLMNKYLTGSSAHIESLVYDEEERTLVVTFFDRPESWKPVVRITFGEIDQYGCFVLDEDEDGFIDMAIGFDQNDDSYCLHTCLVEITFCTHVPPYVEELP